MSTVIKVENLSKRYRLGVINRDMLYKDLQSRWAKFRGKEDPNAPIGLKHDKRLEHGDEFWALRNVDLEVKEGEILGIIGRNGAGKSTLLKILSQITAPTEGSIKVKGRIASLLEVGTGFHPELTGRENVFLNGAILGMTRKEVRSKFDEIVAFAEIDEFIDTPVKRYSSGMYVRLAFAVAAHLDPDILIVDEVLAVGDIKFQEKCTGKMSQISKTGRTILFVSHNLPMMRQLCSAGCILDQGSVVFRSDIAAALEYYRSDTLKPTSEFIADQSKADLSRGSIVKVSIEDCAGRPATTIPVGSKWRVRISAQINRRLEHFIAGFGLCTLDERPFRVTWTQPRAVDSGLYEITFEEGDLQISRGAYKLHVGLSEHTSTFHFEEDCGSIRLIEGNEPVAKFNVPGVILNNVAHKITKVEGS